MPRCRSPRPGDSRTAGLGRGRCLHSHSGLLPSFWIRRWEGRVDTSTDRPARSMCTAVRRLDCRAACVVVDSPDVRCRPSAREGPEGIGGTPYAARAITPRDRTVAVMGPARPAPRTSATASTPVVTCSMSDSVPMTATRSWPVQAAVACARSCGTCHRSGACSRTIQRPGENCAQWALIDAPVSRKDGFERT